MSLHTDVLKIIPHKHNNKFPVSKSVPFALKTSTLPCQPVTTSQNSAEELLFLKPSTVLSQLTFRIIQHSTVTHKTGSCSRMLVGRFIYELLGIWHIVGTNIWHIVDKKYNIQRTGEGPGSPHSELCGHLSVSALSVASWEFWGLLPDKDGLWVFPSPPNSFLPAPPLSPLGILSAAACEGPGGSSLNNSHSGLSKTVKMDPLLHLFLHFFSSLQLKKNNSLVVKWVSKTPSKIFSWSRSQRLLKHLPFRLITGKPLKGTEGLNV